MAKSYRRPHAYKKKKSIIRNRFFWLAILISGLVVFSFYFFFFSDTFQVENVNIRGGNKVAKEDIDFLVRENLESRFLFFPTKTILLASLKNMREEILSSFPQIAKAEIKRSWPDTINVLITERKGMVNWCGNGKYFLADSEGIVFEEIDEPKTGLAVVANLSSALPGDRVIEPDDLNLILNIESQLQGDLKIAIKDFVVSSEDKLTVNTQEGWQIYFNLQGDVSWQITKLRAVIEEKFPPENRGNLEYIELRFGNFANPRYKD